MFLDIEFIRSEFIRRTGGYFFRIKDSCFTIEVCVINNLAVNSYKELEFLAVTNYYYRKKISPISNIVRWCVANNISFSGNKNIYFYLLKKSIPELKLYRKIISNRIEEALAKKKELK